MSENEMKILKHRMDSEDWNTITSSEYDDEENLQQIIADKPELIPVSEILDNRSEIKVAVRELPISGSGPSGSTGSCDIVGLDEEGNIYVIEAKLESNAEVKREVLAQTFDYASSLFGSDYREFIDDFEEEWDDEGIEEFMRGLTNSETDDFNESVQKNLDEGRFTLLIVVDKVNTNLEKILEFMNRKLDGIEVYAVAFRRFTEGESANEIEYLVPRIFGTSVIESSQNRSESQEWPFEAVKEEYDADNNIFKIAKLASDKGVYEPADSKSGPRFQLKWDQCDSFFMSVIPDGRLYCNLKENQIDKRFGSEEKWNEFRSILSKYEFYPDNFDSAKNSNRSLKKMDDELEQFKEDLDEFIN